MNGKTIFGLSRNGVALALIVTAILFIILASLLLLGSTWLGILIPSGGGKEGIPVTTLLTAIIVLLSTIVILLLVLLWCCCRHGRKGISPELLTLVALLPKLPSIPEVLRDIAIALHESGKALGWIRENLGGNLNQGITGAGQVLVEASTLAGTLEIPVPRFETVDISIAGVSFTAVRNVDFNHKEKPLNGLKAKLHDVGVTLKTHAQEIDQVTARLNSAGKTLGLIAQALGSPPPNEVIQ